MRRIFAVLALVIACTAHAATCYVSEFSNASPVLYQAAQQPAQRDDHVQSSSSSVTTAAFLSTTRLVRVVCDVATHYAFGTTPTASATNSALIPAGAVEYFAIPAPVQGGATQKVAFIAD